MRRTIHMLLAASLVVMLHTQCNKPTQTTGTGSGTGNAFSGRIVYQDNSPAPGVTVRIYPVDYVPSFAKTRTIAATTKTTDSNGYYSYADLDSGTYNVDAIKETLGVFVDSIIIQPDSAKCKVPNGILKELGLITGISHMPGQSDTNQIRVTLYMPGTGRTTKPIIGGKFGFDQMPAGKYQLIIDPTLNEYNVKILDISLNAGDTLDLDTVMLQKPQPDTTELVSTTLAGSFGPNKTYRILNNMNVPKGATLTINPGTKFYFMGSYGIAVNGTIICKGDSSAPVLFTYGYPNGNWGSIDCPGSDSAYFSYVIIERSGGGIGISNGNFVATVSHCVFRNSYRGFTAWNNPKTTFVYDNVFSNMLGDANNSSSVTWSIAIGTVDNPQYMAYLVNNILSNGSIGLWHNYYNAPPIVLLSNNCFNNLQKDCILREEMHGVNTPFEPADSFLVNSSPAFVSTDSGTEDYHLQSSSPCKGTGYTGTDMGIYSTFDPATVPFTPRRLQLSYDTIRQTATLTWLPLLFHEVKGYNVYRKHQDSNFVRINTALVTSLTFSDNNMLQDASYEYRITAVDPNDNEGLNSNLASVTAKSAFKLLNSLLLPVPDPSKAPASIALSKDTVSQILYACNGYFCKFNPGGSLIGTYGQDTFDCANHITVDASNFTYISNSDLNKVMKFAPDGAYSSEWTVNAPYGITAGTDNKIYAISRINISSYQFFKFDSAGNTLASTGTITRNQFTGDMIVDGDSMLYVGHGAYDAVEVYNRSLSFQRKYNITFLGHDGRIPGDVSTSDIQAVDSKGNMYFFIWGWVAVFDKYGNLTGKFNPDFYSSICARILGDRIYCYGNVDGSGIIVKTYQIPF